MFEEIDVNSKFSFLLFISGIFDTAICTHFAKEAELYVYIHSEPATSDYYLCVFINSFIECTSTKILDSLKIMIFLLNHTPLPAVNYAENRPVQL